MEMLEKVELIREKCNVSYEEARNALEACDGDVLDAIVMLEQAQEATARKTAEVPPVPDAAYELPEVPASTNASDANTGGHGQTKAGKAWGSFCNTCRGLWREGMTMSFVAERNGEALFALPVAVVVLGLLFWGASLWLLVIGLFLGCRYRIEGGSKAARTVNDAMDKAADAADSIKESVA